MKKWLVSGGILIIMFPMLVIFMLLIACSGNNDSGKSANPVAQTQTQEEFITGLSTAAKKTQEEYKVFASVTIGQAILESGWGQSGLTARANNLFGIKAANWTGPTIEMMTQEEVNGGMIWVPAQWRVYNSWEDSILDHGKFLKENSRYTKAGVFKAKNYREQLEAIKKAGYATESNYVSLVCGIIESYKLNEYDL